MTAEEGFKTARNAFQRHVSILIWKAYIQRQRRWRMLLTQTILAAILFLIAVFIAKPVFLNPLQDQPEPPLTSADILESLHSETILGYAPNEEPYDTVMLRASGLLRKSFMSARTYDDLNLLLYQRSKTEPKKQKPKVIWVIFTKKEGNLWKVSIRSTEVARYSSQMDKSRNMHLRAGFLAVQMAVSQAICEFASEDYPEYELGLVAMPVSPLMESDRVRRVTSLILLCYTLALLPPVMETEALVVSETRNTLKRALRMRNVGFGAMYIGWLTFAVITSLPICLIGSVTLILIFRWIHLMYALLTLLAYTEVMMMLALIMAMFHRKAWIACIWSMLFTLMQTFLAELMVHHKYDEQHRAVTFMLHMLVPPLGLVHGFNEFALLQTGREIRGTTGSQSLVYTIVLWLLMILLYFQLLMLLQRTIGQERAIGGQVSWKSIIFKHQEDVNKLRPIYSPTGRERENLQEVDEFVAKAVSFRDVSKNIMGVPMLTNVTFDIYRGEYTNIYAENIQEKMILTIENLLVGLTQPDKGTINVLGKNLKDGKTCLTEALMMGYCHSSKVLIQNLTVEEHFLFFMELCMWRESRETIEEYTTIRMKRLMNDCELLGVRHVHAKNLDPYYRAQLCWAIAMITEPRVVVIPNFTDHPMYMAVIKDKIVNYRKFITIVKFSYSSTNLEYADRVFIFDNKILGFGGTPAYMFFKYGREYRFRMTFRSGATIGEGEGAEELLQRAREAGATVRAHLGSMLILRLPASPTDKVAALVKDIALNTSKYGISSMNISLPDSEEVCMRAINESRAEITPRTHTEREELKRALRRIAEPETRPRIRAPCCCTINQLRCFSWKYFSFYVHFRFFLIITIISTMVAGVFIGLSLGNLLTAIDRDPIMKKVIHGEKLTVEALEQKTTLVLRLDNTQQARSISNAYVLSQTKATQKEIKNMAYTALARPDSLIEYLVTRAIDSPQHYVYMYAYGVDVKSDEDGRLIIQALYSPLHQDQAAAARSLARTHMALIRHFTGDLTATIAITNNPLILDQTPWMKHASTPPLLIQFLLVLTISHITLIPSKEHGLIRHMQAHAYSFSPVRYWITLLFCDLILYWILVTLMTVVIGGIMYLVVPKTHFYYKDLLVVPFMLMVYGLGCVPQAYLFSLGPRPALNSMAFVIFNIVFGEATIVAKLFYGNVYNFAMNFMLLSPQFNIAYALVKIKKIFVYNSECIIFKTKNLCSEKVLHKCCEKCGVLQNCYKKQSYMTFSPGILGEVIAIISTAVIFLILLLLWEYRVPQRLWNFISFGLFYTKTAIDESSEKEGARRERIDVTSKKEEIKLKQCYKVDTYGEYLLATNLCQRTLGHYSLKNIYLGLGKGEALAVAGLKRHGRTLLSEIIAGFRNPEEGVVWTMAKWTLHANHHNYARQIGFCCDRESVPGWMTVYDCLELIGALRGVPKAQLNNEIQDYIVALELNERADILVCRLLPSEMNRLMFAAAIIGAPPIIVLDECTAYQKYSVIRAMYYILYQLRRRGHSIFMSSHSVESHMSVSNRLAIMLDGKIYDVDTVENLLNRHGNLGYTVAVHLKDEVDVHAMFRRYFQRFYINDSTEVLVNLQIMDTNLDWATIFDKMERLKAEHQQVYSYIVSAIPIDYIYNKILLQEKGHVKAPETISWPKLKKIMSYREKVVPSKEQIDRLSTHEKKYDITTLTELPWSVIFQR